MNEQCVDTSKYKVGVERARPMPFVFRLSPEAVEFVRETADAKPEDLLQGWLRKIGVRPRA